MAKVYDALRRAEEERKRRSGAPSTAPSTPLDFEPARPQARAAGDASLAVEAAGRERRKQRAHGRLQQASHLAAAAGFVRRRAVSLAARPHRRALRAAADSHDRGHQPALGRRQDDGRDQPRDRHLAEPRPARAADRLRPAQAQDPPGARAASRGRARRGALRRGQPRLGDPQGGGHEPRGARRARQAGRIPRSCSPARGCGSSSKRSRGATTA